MLSHILENHQPYHPVIITEKPYKPLDFSAKNTGLLSLDLSDTEAFTHYVFNKLLSGASQVGYGGYDENRVIYRQREHFGLPEKNPRCIHLGIDIWSLAGEPIYAPLDGAIHSFAFNNHFGDYGPTIILQHTLEGLTFFTLYGHLSLLSLNDLEIGQKFPAGHKIGEIGNYPENGDWPPHLHFQIISDMGHYQGDFPGVCSQPDRNHYLSICPDPQLILSFGCHECTDLGG